MDKSLKFILFNSTLAFVSAFIITTVIHEGGHFVSYFLFGAKPTLYHNYVQTLAQQLSLNVKVISGLAGPFSSLFQGIIFGLLVTGLQKSNARYLLYLWLSLLGFINFFGYLVMTPLSTAGDTGQVAELLHLGYPIRIIIAITGFILLIFAVMKMGKYFSIFIPNESARKSKAKYVYHVMFFPIIIGSLFNTLLAFPVVSVLSIVYPATSPYVIMSSFSVILKSTPQQSTRSEIETGIMKWLVLLVLCALILNRLLTLGVG